MSKGALQSIADSGRMIEVELDDLGLPEWTLRPLKEELVTELMRSIRSAGLLQPIVVRSRSGRYEVVFGNHRLEACRRLGVKHVKVLVRDFSEEEAFLARLSENLLRNSFVNPIEEAEGYAMLVTRGWTINAIGEIVGKCDSYICERMRILDRLSKDVRPKVSSGVISASHAELISRIADSFRQSEVAQLVIKKKLSVRSLEDLLNGVPPPTKIQVECIAGECYLHIPREFAKVIAKKPDQELFIYIRGSRRLVIENVDSFSGKMYHLSPGRNSHVRNTVPYQKCSWVPTGNIVRKCSPLRISS